MNKILLNVKNIIAVGKRKTSIANVCLIPGTGIIKVNDKMYEDFFQSLGQEKEQIKKSLIFLNFSQTFDIFVKVKGGGLVSQLESICLGISKALSQISEKEKQLLSKNGFLYRDSRIKERRKYGLKKARKAPQYSKR